ncbi:CDP-glycerol glycerophosphotransferase family protein [Planktosalinus lacus]|uniref:UDP-glycosyltransferase n=1 Tax=Planktosalinus lacus TaxID=1526573 RepID=A0A8J2V8M3_9FLAO|nr:CDP-glycerol glycerophosphotransferase family protein [Planktosalinus lacus]GGD84739.1 hypothetical protein GCM10011312_05930 [Planktosalinus lacus]
MPEQKKIFLMLPDGIGIRNYLYTNVFDDIEKECTIVHNFDVETIEYIKSVTNIKRDFELPNYKETVLEKFYRELICVSRLRFNTKLTNNKTILKSWNYNYTSWHKKLFYILVTFISKFIKNYRSILYLEKKYAQSVETNPFYIQLVEILKKEQPAKIFCTHQRAIKAAPLMQAAKKLGIETITVIYSWDNLPKARLALRTDLFLVWSEHMKEEMKQYYPEIPESTIHITGTPQFEPYYKSENIIPKEEFFSKYGLNTSKKNICFSGDDVKTSPDDPKYLNDLAEAIMTTRLHKDYQIILRQCPVDVSGRFKHVIDKYPGLIKEVAPVWRFDGKTHWTTVYPDKNDLKILTSTVFYSDLVINVGSTMAFDFAMFEKPCIFINYDQENKTVPGWSVKTIYQFQHFRTMPKSQAVYWLNDKNEISEMLQKIEYAKVQKGMELWKMAVLGDFQNASNKINKLLKS